MWACNCKKSDTQPKGMMQKGVHFRQFWDNKTGMPPPCRSIQLIIRCEMKKRLVANSWGRFLHCFKIFVGVFWISIWQFVRPMIIDGWYCQRCSLIRNVSQQPPVCLLLQTSFCVFSPRCDHDQDIFIDTNDWVQSSSFLLRGCHYSICLNI